MTVGCVFCAIVGGEGSSYPVGESDRALAFLDINPAAEGHALVIPKVHADDIWDLDPEDGRAVWSLAQDIAALLQDRLHPDGMTLFQANGQYGWQHVFHFHLHVVPRWSGDALQKPWEITPGDPAALTDVSERLLRSTS
jgi:histidine triad (HIT) family protein